MNNTPENRIANFPVSFFSVIMGLAGLTIASQKIEHMYGMRYHFSTSLFWVTMAIFAVMLVAYSIKSLFFLHRVREEFRHPVRLSFFPTISISMLLISIALLEISMDLSYYFWIVGTTMHLYMTLKILSIWVHHTKFEIHHMSPAWFIPVVGNILIPVAGVQHASTEVSWFFFSTGLIFWLALFAIVLNRIIFHAPLAQKMMPTLFILIAPPAVGFISYVKLANEIDAFSRILYYFALFLTLLLTFQVKQFVRLKFFISWWAFSFPIAAITIATTLMYSKTNILLYKHIALTLYLALVSIILVLLSRTIISIAKKDICVEEVDAVVKIGTNEPIQQGVIIK